MFEIGIKGHHFYSVSRSESNAIRRFFFSFLLNLSCVRLWNLNAVSISICMTLATFFLLLPQLRRTKPTSRSWRSRKVTAGCIMRSVWRSFWQGRSTSWEAKFHGLTSCFLKSWNSSVYLCQAAWMPSQIWKLSRLDSLPYPRWWLILSLFSCVAVSTTILYGIISRIEIIECHSCYCLELLEDVVKWVKVLQQGCDLNLIYLCEVKVGDNRF